MGVKSGTIASICLWLPCLFLGLIILWYDAAQAKQAPASDTPTISDAQKTATVVIARATQTQAALDTISPRPSPNNNQMTATVIVAGATQTQSALETPAHLRTPAAIPTLSQTDIEEVRFRWVTELEAAAGFQHPIFDYFVDEMLRRVPRQIDFENERGYHVEVPLQDYDIDPLVVEASTAQGTYVALIFSTSTSHISRGFKDQFLIFRLVDESPVLLPNPIPYGGVFDLGFIEDPTPFADRNGNGYPDMAISNGNVIGSSGCLVSQTLILIEIQPDGTVDDITPSTSGRFYVRGLRDLDGDGIQEIAAVASATNPEYTSKCAYHTTQWFAWNGMRYEDISDSLNESIYPAVAEFWAGVEELGCIAIDPTLYQMLWDEHARGNLEDVWDDLKAEYEFCATNPIALEQLEEWITNFLL